VILYSLAEAYEQLGNLVGAGRAYEEISGSLKRGSFAGDIYARSLYRNALILEHNWHHFWGPAEQDRTMAIKNYRKFLSLWGDADPIFKTEIEDARRRLAVLEAEE
jgi:hypothetical protein